MMATGQRTLYKIGGISVYFPGKPYPSQFSMMDKIIKGIEKGQNCLLESPTGSGKSLALLCSALAWQAEQLAKRELEDLEETVDKSSGDDCCCQCHTHQTAADLPNQNSCDNSQCDVSESQQNTDSNEVTVIDDDDDFKDSNTSFRTPNINKSIKKRKHVSISYEDDYVTSPQRADNSFSQEKDTDQQCRNDVKLEPNNCDCCSKNNTPKTKVPKIYFGTRTHKQVSQIVRELKKTAYHDVRMTILGSREHTCIHPVVSRSTNKNEGCTELIKGPGCRFKDRTKRLESQKTIKVLGLDSAWDLEDLVGLCKNSKACPYFLSRGLKSQCELVICPYNYLIDPIIRDSMEISLKNEIIILDEAHNIEDSSREAASQSVHLDTLEKAVHEIDKLIELNLKVGDYLKLKAMVSSIMNFINRNSHNLQQKDFEQSCKIWSGFDIAAQMESIDLGPKNFPELTKALVSVCEELDDATKQRLGDEGKLSNAILAMFEQIFLVFKNIYKDDMKYIDDYRVSLLKTTSYTNMPTNGTWLNPKQRRGSRVPVVTFSLNFWCMSPAVAFSDFSESRCVVLSSGTLSPMSSFQSELGLLFPIQLEANHVIKDNQVWVGSLGQGPSGSSLQAVYKNLETFTFQDELGQLVLKVCQTVPKGVLCFLPSYKVLDKLTDRWQTTGLWNQIRNNKVIVSEPRGKDKEDFEYLMKKFYMAAEGQIDEYDSDDCESYNSDITGAIFFAVCRGKVSEGLDFADNYARAVISVGIPYPNFKDLQVELKRKYNDEHRIKKGLLSGSEWYEIQAFRALNQALGRCIRHRKDWGSLILVDDRFVKNGQKYCKGLSKWVRNKVRTFHDFRSGLASLNDFIDNRVEHHDREQGLNISGTPSTPAGASTGKNDSILSPQGAATTTSLYSFNRKIFNGGGETPQNSIEDKIKAEIRKFNERLGMPITPKVEKTADVTSEFFQSTSTPVLKPPPMLGNKTPVSTKLSNPQINGVSTSQIIYVPHGQQLNIPTLTSPPLKSPPVSQSEVVYQCANQATANSVSQVILSPPTRTQQQNMLTHTTPQKVIYLPIGNVLPSTNTVGSQNSNQVKIFNGLSQQGTVQSNNIMLISPPKGQVGVNGSQILQIISPPTGIQAQASGIKSPPTSGTGIKAPPSVVTAIKSPPTIGTGIKSPTTVGAPSTGIGTPGTGVNANGSNCLAPGNKTTVTQQTQQTYKVVNGFLASGKPAIFLYPQQQVAQTTRKPNQISLLGQNNILPSSQKIESLTKTTASASQMKSQPSEPLKPEAEATSVSITSTDINFNKGTANNPIEISGDVDESNIYSSSVKRDQNVNKLFKFCKIPDQKDIESPNISSNNSTAQGKETLDIKSSLSEDQNKVTPMKEDAETSNNGKILKNGVKSGITDSPTLFDSESETDNVRPKTICRKPLFKTKAKEVVTLDNSINEEKPDIPPQKRARKGRLSLSGSKQAKGTLKNKSQMEEKDSEIENKVPSNLVNDPDEQNTEDNLTIRRSNRQKRRRSSGNVRQASNKKAKGVEFLEEIDNNVDTEPIKKISNVMCQNCGIILVNSLKEYEKRRRVPPFLPTEGSKIREVLYLSCTEEEDNIRTIPWHKEQELRSCKSQGVQVEYFQCNSCYPKGTTVPTVLGCKVIQTDTISKYQTGQTWMYMDSIVLE